MAVELHGTLKGLIETIYLVGSGKMIQQFLHMLPVIVLRGKFFWLCSQT